MRVCIGGQRYAVCVRAPDDEIQEKEDMAAIDVNGPLYSLDNLQTAPSVPALVSVQYQV